MPVMYAVQLAFSDDDTRLALRPQHRERLAHLAAEGRLLAAGPWSDESGALLVFTSTAATTSTRSSPAIPTTRAPA